MLVNFHLKGTTLTFFSQFVPKKKLGFEIRKANVETRTSIFEIPPVSIFRQNKQIRRFGPTFSQPCILGSKIKKSKSGFGISIVKILYVPIFRNRGQL